MSGKIVQVFKVAAVAVAVSLLLILICAFFAYKLKLGDAQLTLCVAMIYAAGSFVAGFGLGRIKKEKRLLWGGIGGTTYFILIVLLAVIVNHGAGIDWGNLIRSYIICVAAGIIGGICG